jgi:hypothetical protein
MASKRSKAGMSESHHRAAAPSADDGAGDAAGGKEAPPSDLPEITIRVVRGQIEAPPEPDPKLDRSQPAALRPRVCAG